MRSTILAEGSAAISRAPECGSDFEITPASESEDLDWFVRTAWGVLGKDAGLHLHYITGYPESSCYAYVARNRLKRRKPPEHFLRKLFHSPQGAPFHDAFMRGCNAPWWRELEERRADAERFREIAKIVNG